MTTYCTSILPDILPDVLPDWLIYEISGILLIKM